ncbi:MAG: hypothetical protein ACPGPF_01585 [Pontibacterium sp.]
MDFEPEVIISAITAISSIAIALITKIKSARSKQDAQSYKAEAQRIKRDFARFVSLWSVVVIDIERLIEETEVDRFLMLEARGLPDPKVTNSIYQIRSSGQHVVDYVDVELDEDYISKLKKIIRDNQYYFIVKDESDCLIKRIYDAEGVKTSFWALIAIEETDEDRVITYCSFASHSGEISLRTQTKCTLITNRLSGTSRKING